MRRPILIASALHLAILPVSACSPGNAVSPSPSASQATKASPPSPPLFGWAYEGTVRVNAVDPRTVALADGGYRQIYGTWRSWQPGPGGPGARGIDPYAATAVSTDGLHWTEEGKLGVGYLVPVRLPDGRYRAYHNTSAYISSDAKNWRLEGPIRPPEASNPSCGRTSGLVSDVIVMPDQTFRVYYNCQVGELFNLPVSVINSATSKDGLIWNKDAGVRIDPRTGAEILRSQNGNPIRAGTAEHPRVVTLPDGSLKMFYWSSNDGVWSATSVDGLTWTNRQPEGIFGGDPDAIVLPDGRLRLFVNGLLGFPGDFNANTIGERQRIVSYIYGPVRYRVSVHPDRVFNGVCNQCPGLTAPLPPPEYVTVKIEGSGPMVTLGAIGYSPSVSDLVTDPASPVQVEFSPLSGSPPFTALATIHLRQRAGTTIVLVANNGTTEELTPLKQGLPPGA